MRDKRIYSGNLFLSYKRNTKNQFLIAQEQYTGTCSFKEYYNPPTWFESMLSTTVLALVDQCKTEQDYNYGNLDSYSNKDMGQEE